MKRIFHFAEAFAHEIAGAVTPAEKRIICEGAKKVIGVVMTGPWAALATAIVNDLEKTIVDPAA